DAERFEIRDSELWLVAGTVLDFETGPTLAVTMEIDDPDVGGEPDDTAALQINLTDVNESPAGLTLSSAVIAENVSAGTSVGTFSTTDPDPGTSFQYLLVAGPGSADNATFALDAAGALTTAAVLDYEAQHVFSIRVR